MYKCIIMYMYMYMYKSMYRYICVYTHHVYISNKHLHTMFLLTTTQPMVLSHAGVLLGVCTDGSAV